MTAGNARQEAVQLPELPLAGPTGQNAQRARSLTSAFPAALDGDTPSRAQEAGERLAGWLRRLPERRLDLIHGPPASAAAMHARHGEAAARYEGAIWRRARLAWGLLHTLATVTLLAALDVAFSPLGALAAVVFAFAIWHWS